MRRSRPSVLRSAPFRSALVPGVLLVGALVLAAGCSSGGSETSTVSTAPTTAAVTTAPATSATTATTAPATTAPATTTTAPATTTPPTTMAAPAATTPEAAAKGLYAAWKAGDEAAAAAFGDPAAVNKLFERAYTGPDLQFIGCEPDGDVYSCSYYYEGGAETYRTTGSATAGYRVIEITELAD